MLDAIALAASIPAVAEAATAYLAPQRLAAISFLDVADLPGRNPRVSTNTATKVAVPFEVRGRSLLHARERGLTSSAEVAFRACLPEEPGAPDRQDSAAPHLSGGLVSQSRCRR